MRSVKNISPGLLKAGLPSVNGQRRVKIKAQQGRILLSIRDNTSHQEVHVYTGDIQTAMLDIARSCRDKKINISFRPD